MNVSRANKLWGEIEDDHKEQHYVTDVSAAIVKSMNKFCLAEFDTDENDSQKMEQIFLDPMDPLMMFSISLHKYLNDMTEKIRVAELAIESDVLPPKDAAPSIPEFNGFQRKHEQNSLNYIPKEFTPFTVGEEVVMPEISEAVAKQILIKSVAVMFAHIGYETTHQSVLDFMVDVLETILKTVAIKLKIAYEDEVNEESFGFPNILERVFVEIGIGGLKGLHDYYENRIVKYVNVLKKRCEDLNDHYENLLVPQVSMASDSINNVLRIKVEQEDIAEENPEMHLETSELGSSTLETGFQLLNSLEAGTNLIEDDAVASSSGIVPIIEMDVSHSSPISKKKRAK